VYQRGSQLGGFFVTFDVWGLLWSSTFVRILIKFSGTLHEHISLRHGVVVTCVAQLHGESVAVFPW